MCKQIDRYWSVDFFFAHSFRIAKADPQLFIEVFFFSLSFWIINEWNETNSLMCRLKFGLYTLSGQYINIKLTPLQNIKCCYWKIEWILEKKKKKCDKLKLIWIESKRFDLAMNTKQCCLIFGAKYTLWINLPPKYEKKKPTNYKWTHCHM